MVESRFCLGALGFVMENCIGFGRLLCFGLLYWVLGSALCVG